MKGPGGRGVAKEALGGLGRPDRRTCSSWPRGVRRGGMGGGALGAAGPQRKSGLAPFSRCRRRRT